MSSRPNIVFIMPDQLRHDFLSCYGADFLSTPHIDRIADEGTRYDKAYSLHPVCVPARSSLLTGINALRTGVLGNFNYLRPDFEACGMRTWPQMLGEQGYYTAAVGKMHFYPWDAMFGLDHRVICEDKVWVNIQDDYYDYLKERGHRKYMGKEHPGYDENYGAVTSLLPWDCYWDYFVGEEAARFVREYDEDRPFALMVGFPGPHDPYDPTAEWLEKIDASTIPPAAPGAPQIHGTQRNDGPPANQSRKPVPNRPVWVPEPTGPFTNAIKQKIRAHYAAQVLQIDHEVGQILAALDERGMLDNTIVIFSSDHGEMAGDHNLRGKGNFYEASCHVPMLVRWPGAAPAGAVRDDLVALTDVTATMLAGAGCAVPSYMDSQPLPGLGLAGESANDMLVGFLQGAWMAFDGRYKLCKYASGFQALFDLENDPQEQRDLSQSTEHADQYRRLDTALWRDVMRSAQAGHYYNTVDGYNGLWADREYGRHGQQRPYPVPLGTDPTRPI